jgi:hypothetical protein
MKDMKGGNDAIKTAAWLFMAANLVALRGGGKISGVQRIGL